MEENNNALTFEQVNEMFNQFKAEITQLINQKESEGEPQVIEPEITEPKPDNFFTYLSGFNNIKLTKEGNE